MFEDDIDKRSFDQKKNWTKRKSPDVERQQVINVANLYICLETVYVTTALVYGHGNKKCLPKYQVSEIF